MSRPSLRPTRYVVGLCSAMLALSPIPVDAQARGRGEPVTTRTAPAPSARTMVYRNGELISGRDDRRVIGVSTSSSASSRDTLGLLVESVTPGGPAEKAGVEEGDRLVSVNGVSLRLAREDAGEMDMGGMMTRRLVRELGKVTAGGSAELAVMRGNAGPMRTVRITPIAADSMPKLAREAAVKPEDRPTLGLGVGSTGSKRDTLGAFVSSVAEGGPAELAGIVEGDRIASINGVDLRVAREDAGDASMANVRMNRMRRELRKLKTGQAAELQVVSGGQTRTVRVTAARSGDVYKGRNGMNWSFSYGDDYMGMNFPAMAPMPPMAPMAPMAPMPPMGPMDGMFDGDNFVIRRGGNAAAFRIDSDAVRDAVRDARVSVQQIAPRIAEARARGDAARALLGNGRTMQYLDGYASNDRVRVRGSGTGYTLSLPGLQLTTVNADLASYFGAGSERGLLVTEAGERWPGVKEGDVLLSVNGSAVRTGEDALIEVDMSEPMKLELLRKGKKQTVTVPGRDGH